MNARDAPHGQIRHRDPTTQAGFTAVPNAILTDTRLSRDARFLYALLKQHAWQDPDCFPGQARLAELMGCTDRSVRLYLAELVEAGLVTVEQRGLRQSNRYILEDNFRSDRKCISGQAPDTPPERKPASGLERNPVSVLERKPISVEEDSLEEDSGEEELIPGVGVGEDDPAPVQKLPPPPPPEKTQDAAPDLPTLAVTRYRALINPRASPALVARITSDVAALLTAGRPLSAAGLEYALSQAATATGQQWPYAVKVWMAWPAGRPLEGADNGPLATATRDAGRDPPALLDPAAERAALRSSLAGARARAGRPADGGP